MTYEEHLKNQEARRSNSTGIRGPEAHFASEYLKNDGDTVVVRFPYKSMSDVEYVSTHLVDYPGSKYKKRVICGGKDCELCANDHPTDRALIKMLVYVINENGAVEIKNTVWDRPATYADVTIKNLIDEYGDLTQYLFKIRRSGTGFNNTKYSDPAVVMNKTVYNPAVYKADFTELNQLNPAKLLTKTYAQYQAAMNPDVAESNETENEETTAAATTSNDSLEIVELSENKEEVVSIPAAEEQPRKRTVYSF